MATTPHVIESALLLLVAFLLGCVLGYFLRRLIPRPAQSSAPLQAAAIVTGVSPTTIGSPLKDKPKEDDLKRIKGIGLKLEVALNGAGIHSLSQVANLDSRSIAELDAALSLRGRVVRENWVDQAKALLAQRKKADG